MSHGPEAQNLLGPPPRPTPPATPPAGDPIATNTGQGQRTEFDKHGQLMLNLTALSGRVLATAFAMCLFAVCLSEFSKMEPLSPEQSRWFNALAISITGITSLSLGSLVGYLGSIIRWPLLAEGTHSLRDVSRHPSPTPLREA